MRPRECSDDDIRQASEIVMRISLFTTSHVLNVDRTAFQLNRILEVDICSDQERIEFQTRVTSIRSEASECLDVGRHRFSVYVPVESSSSNIASAKDHLKKSA